MASSDNIFNIGLLALVAYVLYSMGLLSKPYPTSTAATGACPRGKVYNRGLFGDCDPGYTFSVLPGYDQYCECQAAPEVVPPGQGGVIPPEQGGGQTSEQICHDTGGIWEPTTRQCGYGGVVPSPIPPPIPPGSIIPGPGIGNAACPPGYFLDISTSAGAICSPYPPVWENQFGNQPGGKLWHHRYPTRAACEAAQAATGSIVRPDQCILVA